MRFDPHADFVSDPLDAPMPGEMGERSPLKTASVIFLIAIVAGLGGWLWIEGVPGQQKAAAETAAVDADLPKIEPEVVQYAEALISGRNEAERVAAATGSKVDPVVTVRARRSDPGSPVYQAYQQGKRLMSVGRYPEALPYLLEAVRLDPEFAEAHYRLGLTYVRLGDMKAARRERAKLEKLDVDLANLLAHLVNY